MLFIGVILVLLLLAFVAHLVATYFIMKLMLVAFAIAAAVMYFGIYLGLYSIFGDANAIAEMGGSLVIGTSLLLAAGWVYRQSKAEEARLAEEARAEAAAAVLRAEAEKARAAEQARAEEAALRLQAEAAKAVKQKADCPCGSNRPFEDCHGFTFRSAAETVLLPPLKKGWKSLITSINNKL
jgi:hypothetical protein